LELLVLLESPHDPPLDHELLPGLADIESDSC
jgi:hypothetical protein